LSNTSYNTNLIFITCNTLTLPGYRLTVRTLDFHSSNAGSIPANLIIKQLTSTTFFSLNSIKPNLKITYKFSFVSLVPIFSSTLVSLTQINETKLFVKKSYLLATWMYYLKLNEKKNTTKVVKITVLPVRYKLYTFQKAPMAHKTNSQEHFKFKFFFFNLVFNTTLVASNYLNSLNTSLLFFIVTKSLFPVFETNLLFLKSYQLLVFFSDQKYYKYLKI
jgi:hypothetical protein